MALVPEIEVLLQALGHERIILSSEDRSCIYERAYA